MEFPETIEIMGKAHVTSKPSFGVREALVMAWGEHKPDKTTRFLWVRAAAVGLCSGIGALSRASLSGAGFDLLVYGEKVYSYLREQGVGTTEVADLGNRLLTSIAVEMFPTQKEVEDAAGFSEGTVAPT